MRVHSNLEPHPKMSWSIKLHSDIEFFKIQNELNLDRIIGFIWVWAGSGLNCQRNAIASKIFFKSRSTLVVTRSMLAIT